MSTKNNQFLTILDSDIKPINEIFDKIAENKELEFVFNSGGKDKLSKEKYVNLITYIKQIGKPEQIIREETLDINFNNNGNVYRVTVKKNINKYIGMFSKDGNNVIFRTALYVLKQKKNTDTINVIKKIRDNDNIYDIKQFNLRLKLSDEIDLTQDIVANNTRNLDPIINELLSDNDTMPREIRNSLSTNVSFRYKDRTTLYYDKTDSQFIRLDVTGTKMSTKINYLTKSNLNYEMELEIGSKNKIKDDYKAKIFGIVESLLKFLQSSSFLISTGMAQDVILYYKSLINLKPTDRITTIIGKQPISLEIQYVVDKLPDKYAVTDKADGDRYFLIIYKGYGYLISTNLEIKATGIKLSEKNENLYNGSILDGEYIYIPKYNRHLFLVFDALIIGSVDIRREIKLFNRLAQASKLISDCFIFDKQLEYKPKEIPKQTTGFSIEALEKYYTKEVDDFFSILNHNLTIEPAKYPIIRTKFFIGALGAKKHEIFRYSTILWNKYKLNMGSKFPYQLDGLIYQPLEQAYMPDKQATNLPDYKWKPSETNSIDMYIEIKRDPKSGKIVPVYDNSNYDPNDEDEENIKDKTYKICTVYVGKVIGDNEQPVPFTLNDNSPEAYLYLNEGEIRDHEGEIITDKTVVEFTYKNDPKLLPQQRWVPIRTRHDKTESVEKFKKKYGNYYSTAEKVWRSIINPVTIEDMTELGKGNIPGEKNYYDDKIEELTNKISHELIIAATNDNKYYKLISKLGESMKSFHNFMKSNLIYTYCIGMYNRNQKKDVIDFGCGRGGDNMKFYYPEIKNYLGIDFSKENLTSPIDSAISRYNLMRKKHRDFPPMSFIQGDLRALLTSDEQEKAIGNISFNDKKIFMKYFSEDIAKSYKFDVINCQFAVHYFLENDDTWNNFKKNINMTLKEGGFFLVTTLDGERIMEILKDRDNYAEYYKDTKTGTSKIFFDIKKKYSNSNKIGTGLKIEFHGAWIFTEGTYYPEYVVHKDFFIDDLLKDCDLELVDTDLFENQYNYFKEYFTKYCQYQSTDKTRKFLTDVSTFYDESSSDLNVVSKKYSFLNRYYVFRKKNSTKVMTGGNINIFDEEKYYIHKIKEDMHEYSCIYSIYNVLKFCKYIPQTTTFENFISDTNGKDLSDDNLNPEDLQKYCKNLVIEHLLEEENKMKTMINGLNLLFVNVDCNDFIETEVISKHGKNTSDSKKSGGNKMSNDDMFIVIYKDNSGVFNPVFTLINKNSKLYQRGVYKYKDEIIKNLLASEVNK